jgi:hypothetical protein
MAGDIQHYLPASLIGRFGHRSGKHWRTARIAVRAVGSDVVSLTTARRVAFERELYRFKSLPVGTDRDAVDRIWTILEQRLPDAVGSLLQGSWHQDAEETLLFYVASCAVRHPDVFLKVAGDHYTQFGLPEPTPDEVLILRLQSIQATLSQVRPWRWRVFGCSPDADRLVLNDKGFCYLGDTTRATSGLFVPLLPNLGVFGSLDQAENLFGVRRTLSATSVRFVNHALWLEAPREVYGHPAAVDTVHRLDEMPPLNHLGPFMWRHGGGWFD